MRYLYIDFETRMTRELKLSKMTTRAYCEATDVTMVAWALGSDKVRYHIGSPSAELLEHFAEMAAQEDVCVVAFNASFDLRVWHINLGLDYPIHFTCALELARCAWPNQPGGYSLDNLSVQLGLKYKKLKINLEKAQGQELADYCVVDVEALREIHLKELAIVAPVEHRVCEMSNRAKTIYFEVVHEHMLQAVENMSKSAGEAAMAICAAFDNDPEVLKSFGWTGDRPPTTIEDAAKLVPRSVKYAQLKALLLDRVGVDFTGNKELGIKGRSLSLKKVNPAELDSMPEAGRSTIINSSAVGKSLYHRRNLVKFSSIPRIDCELSYAAAHTLRFASRNDGAKGLNLHNMPKHLAAIAKPFRKAFRLDDGWVWVRGDFANVEYRGEGLITGSEYIRDLFTANIFADPYTGFGEWATGLRIDKDTAAGKALRQLFKIAVLGLGYMMGIHTWMTQLLQLLARRDEKGNPEVTIEDLEALAAEKHWSNMSRYAKESVRKLGCHPIVGIVGEKVHELFHQRHPEFAKFGRWLEAAVSRLSYAHDPAAALGSLYEHPCAPPRDLLDLFVDRGLGGSSVRASTSGYPASVCWRDLAIRETLRGPCLTSVLAGHRAPRAITPNILIENVVQYWARTALVKGQLILEDMGHKVQLSIHDEVFILCRNNVADILAAKRDLLKVFGPGNTLGYGWAIVIDPSAVTVSRSLWDDEKWCKNVFWPRLNAGDESVLLEVA